MPTWLLAILVLGAGVQAPAGELIDRTLAIVGGQVITLSDVRAAEALGLLDEPRPGGGEPTLARLVERELILLEVQRYAPPEPAEATVTERLEALRRGVGDPAALARILESTGFTEVRLRAWIRNDLRTEAYLAQRFATAGTPADQEVAEAYQREREAFERAGTSFEAAAPRLRERIAQARRRDLIADWVADLHRRTPVVLFQP